MSWDLQDKLMDENEMRRQRRHRQVSWEEHRDTAWLCRNGVRKAKAQLDLNLARNTKTNKTGFYRCVSQKKKVKGGVCPQGYV